MLVILQNSRRAEETPKRSNMFRHTPAHACYRCTWCARARPAPNRAYRMHARHRALDDGEHLQPAAARAASERRAAGARSARRVHAWPARYGISTRVAYLCPQLRLLVCPVSLTVTLVCPDPTVTPKYARTRPLPLSMPGLRASDTGHKALCPVSCRAATLIVIGQRCW